jgi:aryl-alcohol dehydrogenase-like predicted oxidoreductase
MEKVQLGQTGIEVSALCLGTDAIGSRVDRETSFRLLDLFRQQGGTFLDTGNFYAAWAEGCVGGESESMIGAWLEDRGCRDEMVVATKLGFDYPGCSGGLSSAEIERECEKSLRRLRTDRLDLYYAHRDDSGTPLDETMGAFDRLVRAGKVRAIAASNLRCWRIAEANAIAAKDGLAHYCAVQQRHTYLRPRHAAGFGPQICINDDLRDYCSGRNITLIGYSILLQGAYMRDDRPIPAQFAGPESDERLAALRSVTAETGAAPNQIIIAWLRQSTPAVLPIIAGSRLEQLEENIAALALKLSEAQMDRLTTAGNAEIKQAWLR